MTGQSVALWGDDPADIGKTYSFSPQPNNYKDYYSVGNQLSNTLSFSGGNEKIQTYIAYTRVDATGIIDNNKLKRNDLNLRISGKISPKLSYDGKANYSQQIISNRQYTGESKANNQRHILRIPRNISLEAAKKYQYIDPANRLRQNYWNPGSNGGENPFWTKNNIFSNDDRNRLMGFGSLTYQATSKLSLMARAGVDRTVDNFEGKNFADTYGFPLGEYATLNRDIEETNFDLIGIFKENILDDLTIDATFGASLQHLDRISQSTNAGGLNRPNLFIPSNGRNPSDSRSIIPTEKQGVFATADFTYKNAITVSGSVRNDWSSTLPEANQSYLFGSVGFSAILSSIFNLPSAVSFAKLRGSYATTGNDAEPFLTEQLYNFSAGGNAGFISRNGTKPFPELKPELTTSMELGFEAKFFNDRFGFDFGVYTSDSKNQLFRISVPPASGWNSEFINAGLVNNKGIELTLNGSPIAKGNFRWNIDANFSRNINNLVELSPTLKVLNLTNDFMVFQRAVEGQPLGQMYSRGFIRDASNRVIVGANGLPLIRAVTDVYMGNSRPDWTGGFNNTISFKKFSFSALVTARVGGNVSSFTNAIIYADGQTAETLPGRDSYIFPGVTAAGTPNTVATTAETYWKFVGGRNSPIGEVWSYSATNVRLREASVSYALPKNLFKKAPFQAASVSLVGRNLFFILNKAPGFDPESTAGATNTSVGQEGFSLPSTRQIGLNINLSF
jgi:TonB-linked SusC/RagA family outer membrane protein